MSDPQQNKDEAVEETFISHLVELRDRIIRAGISVIVVFIGLVYWAPDIFQLLARPLMQNLPKDGKMIVTDVTGSFFVPMKVTMLVAFVIALPIVLYQIWAFVAPGLYQHEKKLVAPLVGSSYTLFLCGMAFAYFVVFPDDLSRDGALQRAARRGNDHRHRQLPELRAHDVHRVRRDVRGADRRRAAGAHGRRVDQEAEGNPAVCDRRRVRHFGCRDAAGRVLATDSRDSADRALRGRASLRRESSSARMA